jgi:hypothetical protein
MTECACVCIMRMYVFVSVRVSVFAIELAHTHMCVGGQISGLVYEIKCAEW